jgi:hypothetical protein
MKRIIVFEGLLQGSDGPVCKKLRSLGYKVEGYRHSETLPIWDKVKYPGSLPALKSRDNFLIISHSLGGESALLNAIPGDLVITLDPRKNNIGSFLDVIFRFEQPLSAPVGVTVYNYYQRKDFLPGNRVIGAEYNRLVNEYRHMTIPNVLTRELVEFALGRLK